MDGFCLWFPLLLKFRYIFCSTKKLLFFFQESPFFVENIGQTLVALWMEFAVQTNLIVNSVDENIPLDSLISTSVSANCEAVRRFQKKKSAGIQGAVKSCTLWKLQHENPETVSCSPKHWQSLDIQIPPEKVFICWHIWGVLNTSAGVWMSREYYT